MAIGLHARLSALEVVEGREGIEAGAQPHQVVGGAADREGVLLAQLLQHRPDIAADLGLQIVATGTAAALHAAAGREVDFPACPALCACCKGGRWVPGPTVWWGCIRPPVPVLLLRPQDMPKEPALPRCFTWCYNCRNELKHS